MAIFSLCLFGLAAAILNQVLGRWAGQLGERATKTDIESLRLVQESIRSYRELSASGRKGFFADKFYDVRMQGAKTNAELQILSQVSKFVFEGTLIAGVAGIALAYSFFTTATEALVTIAIFFAVGARISPSILRIQSASVSMRTSASVAMPSLELVGALFPRGVQLPDVSRRSIRNEDHHLDRLPYPPRIELSNVSFYHSNSSELAVDSVSFTIASGESLALVGPSGSGKTTLVDLLLGVRRPNSGSLTIDSMAPKDYCQVRPGAVAYVPQTTFLTEGTIGQNVSLGIPESLVDANRVAVSLEEAKFLTGSKPSKKNPDSLVGEHGLRLSGGQRQRLGIARALYSRPRLIVLDEATSALDSTTELAVADHFAAFSGEVTLVVVSHRLSTIRHCDRIAFMSSGKIVAIGSFSDLMKKVPEFKTQVESSGFL
jgi:ABC-type multidrug transport system fused ATPase/permease subunit